MILKEDGKVSLNHQETKIFDNFFNTPREAVMIQEGAAEINIYNNNFSGTGNQSGIKLLASEDIKEITVSIILLVIIQMVLTLTMIPKRIK